MAFQLRTKSPIKQIDPMSQFKANGKTQRINKSLESSNKAVDKSKANKKSIDIGEKVSQDWDRQSQLGKSVIQIADPTGISSYGDVKKAWSDNKFTSDDIIEPIGALPAIGYFGKTIKGLKAGSDYLKVSKLSKALNIANKSSDIITAARTPLDQKKSPLLKQKLSPKAAKAKAIRDQAYAETPDRRAKKADDQRRHRHDPSGKGKDWDHEDGRWESPAQNRGNDGNGTKSEKGKNYKINKNS